MDNEEGNSELGKTRILKLISFKFYEDSYHNFKVSEFLVHLVDFFLVIKFLSFKFTSFTSSLTSSLFNSEFSDETVTTLHVSRIVTID